MAFRRVVGTVVRAARPTHAKKGQRLPTLKAVLEKRGETPRHKVITNTGHTTIARDHSDVQRIRTADAKAAATSPSSSSTTTVIPNLHLRGLDVRRGK
ncbi:hypothetical protein PTSG_10861 [Salpingoeca rosetta]|uniref:Uncharacterized protein n=1 Tax=Salpingoeca rosetta (strain ATCC 50818 / BSB-021) TaxID=946362 RepID=F2UR77_SALR5|nr:uncharacterized protein PTSG_10861 [Salpingoeca rosetta]EGD80180.1 hypothetical protein PTSG_10861 [Salpingoeca rosetta]|eukprot:XP_004988242.1 hypothetical protein PTSG_10861 [Salpingoeca rosetta]